MAGLREQKTTDVSAMKARIMRDQERERKMRGAGPANSAGLKPLLGFGFFLAISLLIVDKLGYTDTLLDLAGLSQYSLSEKHIQKDFKIKSKVSPEEIAISLGLGLPVFHFGDEYYFQHTAKNANGFMLASGELHYMVVGMVGDRVNWRIGEEPTRMTSRNPFFGDLESFTEPDEGRSPSSLTYEGDSHSFFPLRVGGKMQLTRTSNPAETYSCEVIAEEIVEVPAGKFETMRVECKSAGTERVREDVFHYGRQAGFWVQRRTVVKAKGHERIDLFQLNSYKRAAATAAVNYGVQSPTKAPASIPVAPPTTAEVPAAPAVAEPVAAPTTEASPPTQP